MNQTIELIKIMKDISFHTSSSSLDKQIELY